MTLSHEQDSASTSACQLVREASDDHETMERSGAALTNRSNKDAQASVSKLPRPDAGPRTIPTSFLIRLLNGVRHRPTKIGMAGKITE